MQLSKKKINPKVKRHIHHLFYQTVADIRHPKQAKEFLNSFLAKSELRIAVRRMGIAYFLNQEKPYSYIKNRLSVSSATISTIAERLKKKEPGIEIALEKIKAEEWAEKWAKKFSKIMRRGR